MVDIQQELSIYAAEIITEEAIKQCARKDGEQLIEQIKEDRLYEESSDDEYSDNEESYTHKYVVLLLFYPFNLRLLLKII